MLQELAISIITALKNLYVLSTHIGILREIFQLLRCIQYINVNLSHHMPHVLKCVVFS